MIENRLRVLLAERRMNMRDLATLTGKSYTTINRFEKNERELISRATLEAVCKALSVQPGDILAYVPDDPPIAE